MFALVPNYALSLMDKIRVFETRVTGSSPVGRNRKPARSTFDGDPNADVPPGLRHVATARGTGIAGVGCLAVRSA